MGSLFNLLPQQRGHLLQAALIACALPHTSERFLSLILTTFYSLGDLMQVTGFLWLKLGPQTPESSGRAGNGIKVLQENTKSSSGKTPDSLRNTTLCPWKLSRPFGEYVVGHVWLSGAWDKETFRPLAGKEYPRARWLWPTITASRSPQTGQVTYKTKGPAVANWLACAKQSLPAHLVKVSPIASLLEVCLGIL